MERVDDHPRRWALIALLLVGGLGGGWRGLHRAAGPGPPAVWVWDYGASADFALDAGAIVVARRAHWGAPGLLGSSPFGPGAAGERLAKRVSTARWAPLAAAVDRPDWDRARPGFWCLLGPRSDPSPRTMVAAGTFLERWVYSGKQGRWQRAFRLRLPWGARALASGRHGVWVGAARTAELRFYGHDGTLRLSPQLEGVDGIEALCAAEEPSGGGVWVAAGGALARVDRHGSRMPGQGGFAHLVAIRSVAGRPLEELVSPAR